MEKEIRSKTNDTERTRELTEAELHAVSGGWESHENTTITPADSALYLVFSFKLVAVKTIP